MLVLAFAILLATAGVAAGVTAGLHGLGVVFVERVPPVAPGTGSTSACRCARRGAPLAGFA